MQLTYEDSFDLTGADELASEETRNIPFFGFVLGTLMSIGLWGVLAWVVWVIAV